MPVRSGTGRLASSIATADAGAGMRMRVLRQRQRGEPPADHVEVSGTKTKRAVEPKPHRPDQRNARAAAFNR